MLCRSPSSREWGSGGVTPGEIFAITNARRCVLVHFGHKIVSFGNHVSYLKLDQYYGIAHGTVKTKIGHPCRPRWVLEWFVVVRSNLLGLLEVASPREHF